MRKTTGKERARVKPDKERPRVKPVKQRVSRLGWLVTVRPSKNRSIAWWPVDAAGRDVFVCVTLSDGDSLSGYVTDPTFADSVPLSYVGRVKRLWQEEYPDVLWEYAIREVGEPRARRANGTAVPRRPQRAKTARRKARR